MSAATPAGGPVQLSPGWNAWLASAMLAAGTLTGAYGILLRHADVSEGSGPGTVVLVFGAGVALAGAFRMKAAFDQLAARQGGDA